MRIRTKRICQEPERWEERRRRSFAELDENPETLREYREGRGEG